MDKSPEYKHTGIDWLGLIPSQWSLKRTGHLFSERKQKVDDKTFPPLSVTMSGVVDQLSDIAKTDHTDNRKLVRRGDFVINSRSDRKGSSGISPRDGSVSIINIVMEPREFEPAFYEYLFKSFYFKEEFFRNGKGIHWDLWSTKWDQLKVILIPVPEPNTQSLISTYLDKKTSQIDSLIEKIQQKIELLKEQRTSLINQCVTKGLNPDVEMKDSGIEWIGKIPKHWELKKLKYIVSYNTEALTDETDPSYEFTYIEIGDVDYIDGISYKSKTVFSDSPSRARRVLRNGDVIISTVRTYLRAIGLIDREDDLIGSTGFCVLRSSKKVSGKYLSYAVRSEWFISDVISNSEGVSYPAINSSDLVNLKITFPPLNEQIEIENILDVEIERFDDLISKETKRIELLKEYRQSLISNVVTGKMRITEEMI